LDLEPGVVVADRFRLVRPLGKGGMGAVWVAHHTGLDTECAVKFIHEEAARSPELRARFEREARSAAQLRSPHVVQILDHGVWEGTPYIAMELLEGEDLSKRLRRRRPRALEPREVVAIAAQVSRALTRAHAAGLVHRDLKPANIFLVRDDDREIAKVLDFGVAKSTSVGTSMSTDGDTKTGAILGTPFYMSPEQARGNRDVDHRADLWALAVVVYQCLTGKLPFRSDALGDLLVKIIIEPLPVPSAVATVPAGFDLWWTRAVNRDITQRFQSAKELSEALGMALELTIPGSSEVGTLVGIPVVHDSHPSLLGAVAPARPPTPAPAPASVADPPAPVEVDSALLLTAGPTITPGPVHTPAPSPEVQLAGRGLRYAVAAVGALALIGIGAFALHGGPIAPASGSAPSSAAAPSVTEGGVPAPVPSAAASAASVAMASATASVKAPAPPLAVKTGAPVAVPRPAVSAPKVGPKPRTDFGI